MRERGGWGDSLCSNKQYILCFNKREADGELQHLKSQRTQQVDFCQSRMSAGEQRSVNSVFCCVAGEEERE